MVFHHHRKQSNREVLKNKLKIEISGSGCLQCSGSDLCSCLSKNRPESKQRLRHPMEARLKRDDPFTFPCDVIDTASPPPMTSKSLVWRNPGKVSVFLFLSLARVVSSSNFRGFRVNSHTWHRKRQPRRSGTRVCATNCWISANGTLAGFG